MSKLTRFICLGANGVLAASRKLSSDLTSDFPFRCGRLTGFAKVVLADLLDLVEACVQVGGFFGQQGDLGHFWRHLLTVDGPGQTDTQQAGGQVCRQEPEPALT